ncbi:MAG: hypothetical protein RLZZ511_2772 [Cyanobacteriota bacterium]
MVVFLEIFLDVFDIVHEVEHHAVFFAGGGAVEAREGLDGANSAELGIHVHTLEQGFIEASLVLFGDDENAVLRHFQGIGDVGFAGELVEASFGILDIGDIRFFDGAAEGDEGLVGQVHFLHQATNRLEVANGVEARSRTNHRPTASIELVSDFAQKVIEHDATFDLEGVGLEINVVD